MTMMTLRVVVFHLLQSSHLSKTLLIYFAKSD